MEDIRNFWKWFVANRQAYSFINEVDSAERNRLVQAMGQEIHKIKKGLSFLVGSREGDPMQLIISAEGVRTLFPLVEEMVAAAPEIDDWRVIAFKPPQESLEFVLEFRGISLAPKDIWFQGLLNPDTPEIIALRIGFHDYVAENEQNYRHAVRLLLDVVLGERSAALDIAFVDIAPLPPLPAEAAWRRLTELSGYVESRKAGGPS